MKLYYSPGACSLAVHILTLEVGMSVDLIRVDPMTKKTELGHDFRSVNPSGYVPALELDDGAVLTEAAVILQYVADQKPATGALPQHGDINRYIALQWLNFIAMELHKEYSVLFRVGALDTEKGPALARLQSRFATVETALESREYLVGERFGAADAYAWVVLSWASYLAIDLSGYPRIQDYLARVMQRPAVKSALQREGLG